MKIASWKDFFIAVEQMRECQKSYFSRKSHSALLAAKKCEGEIDSFIKEKRSQWERETQQELFKSEVSA